MRSNIFQWAFVIACFIGIADAVAAGPEKVLTDELVAQVKKACMAQEYEGSDEVKLVSRLQCLNGIDMKMLKQRQAAGDKKLEAAIAKMEAQAAMFDQLLKAQSEAAKVAAEQAKKAEVIKRRQQQMGGAMMPMMAPVVLDRPGRYLAATWEMAEMAESRIRIQDIGVTLRSNLQMKGSARIVIKKNGVTLAIAHPGVTNGMPAFNAFYADLDNDGQPDTTVDANGRTVYTIYRGADALNDQLFTSYRPGDYLEVFFLVDSGKSIGNQQIWKTIGAYRLQPPEEIPRKWEMNVSLGSKFR